MGEIGLRVPYLRQVESGFYWEPSRKVRELGFVAEPLGKDAAKALARAKELNRQVRLELTRAEGGPLPQIRDGTVTWAILSFKQSKKWTEKLAASTKRGYGQCLDRIERWAGPEMVEAITRRAVKVWQGEMEAVAPFYAAATLRVFRVLMKHAKNMGRKVSLEDFHELELQTAGGDGEPWEDFEISAYVDEAWQQGRPSMALALMLAVGLGQREGDILCLPRASYVAGMMLLEQRKTGKRLSVPVLPELAREIERAPRLGTIFIISEKSGKPYGEDHFRHVHRRICRAAGIPDERKFMHLRHTAATRLGAAGCPETLIQAITGHQDRGVLGRYVQPDDTMARAAITKLLDHRKRRES